MEKQQQTQSLKSQQLLNQTQSTQTNSNNQKQITEGLIQKESNHIISNATTVKSQVLSNTHPKTNTITQNGDSLNNQTGSNFNHNHTCNHQHNHKHHHNHNSYHNNHHHTCQHLTTCKYYSKQPQNIVVTQLQKEDDNFNVELAQTMIKYLKGDLHRVWTIMDKLSKSKLVDKKLEGVFILKELGLNKGTAPLKCLTTNNGDISKTLNDLMPKDVLKQIPYLKDISKQKNFIMLIDGLPLALCQKTLKKYCLSNGGWREMAIIILFMWIEIASGFFFIPKQYITPQVVQRIKYKVSNMKTKTKMPYKLQLIPIQGTVENKILQTLKQTKKQQLEKVILISQNLSFVDKCLTDFPGIKAMQGNIFLEQISNFQDKMYISELFSNS